MVTWLLFAGLLLCSDLAGVLAEDLRPAGDNLDRPVLASVCATPADPDDGPANAPVLPLPVSRPALAAALPPATRVAIHRTSLRARLWPFGRAPPATS